jgi:hypothetical protein
MTTAQSHSFKAGMHRLTELAPVHFQRDDKGNVCAVLPANMSGILPPPHKFVHTCAGEFRAQYTRACKAYHTEYVRLISSVLAAVDAYAHDAEAAAGVGVTASAAALHEWLSMSVAGKGRSNDTADNNLYRSSD